MNLIPLTPNQVDQAAIYVGTNVQTAQSNLMQAFAAKEGETVALNKLAHDLGAWVSKDVQKIDPATKKPLWIKEGKIEAMDAPPDNTWQPVTEKVVSSPDLKGLQLIAEQRFQHASQVFSMFSALLDKLDQMKQRLIQKFGQG